MYYTYIKIFGCDYIIYITLYLKSGIKNKSCHRGDSPKYKCYHPGIHFMKDIYFYCRDPSVSKPESFHMVNLIIKHAWLRERYYVKSGGDKVQYNRKHKAQIKEMDEEVLFSLQQSGISDGHPCPESSASFSLPLKLANPGGEQLRTERAWMELGSKGSRRVLTSWLTRLSALRNELLHF